MIRIGERSMPRHMKAMPARRRALQQIDLFAGEPQKTIGDMPCGSALPTEIQAVLSDLMTRLILEHAEAEAGDDL